MVIKAKELADKHGFFWPNQFENEANAWIHEQTTGPEIVHAFQDLKKPLDHFVCAYGTGGTMLGVGRYLRKESPNTKIHICEPDNAPMLFSEIPTVYPQDGQGPSTSFEVAHPVGVHTCSRDGQPILSPNWSMLPRNKIPMTVCYTSQATMPFELPKSLP